MRTLCFLMLLECQILVDSQQKWLTVLNNVYLGDKLNSLGNAFKPFFGGQTFQRGEAHVEQCAVSRYSWSIYPGLPSTAAIFMINGMEILQLAFNHPGSKKIMLNTCFRNSYDILGPN